MKCLFVTILLIVQSFIQVTSAQVYQQSESDSTIKISLLKTNAFKKSMIIPSVLILTGIYSTTDNDIINQYDIQKERNERMPNFHTRVDDYLVFAPIVAVFGLNLAGVQGENDLRNRTALLVKTELLVIAITFSLKEITEVPRPDTSEPTSMPSGHTALAFAAATFMHKEYGKQSVWYSIGAYSIASSVGVIRVLNNRHWISDVFVGAGIGIISTNIVYLTHRYKRKKQKQGHVSILPSWHGDGGGISLFYKFN